MNTLDLLTQSIQRNHYQAKTKGDMIVFLLSDAHIGMGNMDYIKAVINEVKKRPNARLVLGGDLLDNPTRNSKGSVIECYMPPQEQVNKAVELLTPVKDKIILILTGNHEERTNNESFINLTQMVATLLGVPNLYIEGFAIGYIGAGENWYTMAHFHKHVRDQLLVSQMNADCLILEHTHVKEIKYQLKLFHNKTTKSSSVQKCYTIHNGSAMTYPLYAQKGGYPLQDVGNYAIEFSSKRNRRIKIHDIADILSE